MNRWVSSLLQSAGSVLVREVLIASVIRARSFGLAAPMDRVVPSPPEPPQPTKASDAASAVRSQM
jgi:hypothetical protein